MSVQKVCVKTSSLKSFTTSKIFDFAYCPRILKTLILMQESDAYLQTKKSDKDF